MKRWSAWLAMLLLSGISLALVFIVMGFRINLTDSIPVGLYRITDIKNLKDAYVIFCPENRAGFQQARDRGYIDSGFCNGNYGYLMKKVVAIQGDIVSTSNAGVFINNQFIPFSKPKAIDGMKRLLPQWRVNHYKLKEDEVLTMTNQSEWSFDSRYYGPLNRGQIIGVIKPIWVKSKLQR